MPDDAKPDTVQQDSSYKPPVPPVTEQQPGSPDAAQVAKEDVDTKIENLGDQLHAAEKWMIWLTGAIAFFGLCTVVVGALQWNAMKGQLREMKSGGVDTHALAETASDQADAAQQFSDTAEDINQRMSDAVDQLSAAAAHAKSSIQATQDAMRLDQRAWVTVEGFKPTTFGTGQRFLATRVFKNTGRTPAIHVHARAVLNPSKPKEPVDWTIAYKAQPKTTEVVGPQEELNSLLDGTKGFPKGLSDAGFEDIKAGRTIVYDYGIVSYCDVFGREHWTKFCNRFLPDSGEWELCDEVASNSVGDNKKAECKAN
jgi:hypothetical protein